VASFNSARRRDDDTVRFPLVLFLVSLGLALGALYVDRPADRPDALAQFRADATNLLLPVFQFIDSPVRGLENVGPWWRRQFQLAEENRQLEIQIAELRAWRDVARSLQETNARYRDALNLQGPSVGERITAWSVVDQSSDFVRSRLIGAGRAQGVAPGYPVVNVYGLIGRTVEVGESSTRVILLTDFNSRIAVMADRSNARALLVGDNSEFPRLDYLGREPNLRPGDRIVTSGDDNVMPRGLPVGEAVLDRDGRWRVALYSRAAPVDLVWIWPFRPVAPPEVDPVQVEADIEQSGDAPADGALVGDAAEDTASADDEGAG
jgi:rod shape-determining protein MreC